MADIQTNKNYDVKANVEVRKLWADQQIAEKECMIKRLEADAEEIVRGQISRIKADILMKKREVAKLYELKDDLDKFRNDEVIDIVNGCIKQLTDKT